MEVVFHNAQAERVYRGNIRRSGEVHLLAEVRRCRSVAVFRCGELSFIYALYYTLLHLRGSRLGEGHDKHSVNRHRVFRARHHLRQTLDKHRRLTRACRRAYQYIAILGWLIYCPRLCFSPLCHLPSLLSLQRPLSALSPRFRPRRLSFRALPCAFRQSGTRLRSRSTCILRRVRLCQAE